MSLDQNQKVRSFAKGAYKINRALGETPSWAAKNRAIKMKGAYLRVLNVILHHKSVPYYKFSVSTNVVYVQRFQ